MNVPNHEKKTFKDMTPEEMSVIVKSKGDCDVYVNGWVPALDDNLICLNAAYRTRPRQLVIPWEYIKPEYKWAAMDRNGCVFFHKGKPEIGDITWGAHGFAAAGALNIDTTLIDWRESLVQRPEGV